PERPAQDRSGAEKPDPRDDLGGDARGVAFPRGHEAGDHREDTGPEADERHGAQPRRLVLTLALGSDDEAAEDRDQRQNDFAPGPGDHLVPIVREPVHAPSSAGIIHPNLVPGAPAWENPDRMSARARLLATVAFAAVLGYVEAAVAV